MSDTISEGLRVRIVSGPAGGAAGAEGTPRRFWGMTSRQRLERAVARASAAPAPDGAAAGSVLVRDDFIFDEMLLPALLRTPGVVLTDAEGEPVAAHLLDSTQIDAAEAALAAGDGSALAPEPVTYTHLTLPTIYSV